jgi:hypothetical protein
MRMLLAAAIAALMAFGQGTDPKPTAADYPAHGDAGRVPVGAEYMVRSIATPKGLFLTNDYLVVEMALYPPPAGMLVNAHEWTLRLNGKKQELMAQTPGIVAASLKYPDWSRRPAAVADVGPVVIGQPAPVERFPGDNRPAQNRIPGQIPRVPTRQDTGVEEERLDISDVIARAALPEGVFRGPVSGYLFFPWRGNPEKIKTVDLIFRPESGAPFTLRIR